MGNSDKSKKKMISRSEMENFSLDSSKFSRDLMNRFMGSSGKFDVKEEENDHDEEIELNLGLSLGGRFGVDKSSKKLMRSSSIATRLPIVRRDDDDDDDAVAASQPPVSYPSLVRTSSLPVETEEEWRKRKELQTLRRMQAKRRRSVKQRNLKADREGGIDVALVKRKGSYVGGNGGGMQGFGGQQLSQGSMESQGGSSSDELESRTLQGSSSCSDLSPISIKSLEERSSQDVGSSGTKKRDKVGRTSGVDMGNPSKQADIATTRGKDIEMNALEDMPCVFTKGDGPNGRRVDGILYKYGKAEEISIMCVCHGNFLSPADFVKHAGGTDVDHPLKHIVVNPNAPPFI
ncbi:hypothetical protein ACH5RR_030439 [Cinchona calisaya]|uniref:Ninja-family protein n=1 Tax=Cinchona calisaya TaxID=153742 RepID=A0ABD2YZS9_9GENT